MSPLSFARLRAGGGGETFSSYNFLCRSQLRSFPARSIFRGGRRSHAPPSGCAGSFLSFSKSATSLEKPFAAQLRLPPESSSSYLSFSASPAASSWWLDAFSAILGLLTLSRRGLCFSGRRPVPSGTSVGRLSACAPSLPAQTASATPLSRVDGIRLGREPPLSACLYYSTSMGQDGGERRAAAPSAAEKLAQLRQLMKDRGLDAFIVYSGDAHGSEIPAPCDERRQFLTGFDGSSGVAVVTADEALLWTDGRYFVQAERQLDPSLWRLMKQNTPGTPKVQDWLFNNPKVKRLGVEGKYTPISEYRQLLHVGFSRPSSSATHALRASGDHAGAVKTEGSCSAKDATNSKEIVIVSDNLVDQVWGASRPPAPTADILVHPIAFSGASTRQKAVQIVQQMRTSRCDVLLLSALDDVAWFLNLRGSDVPCSPVFLSYCLLVDSAPDAPAEVEGGEKATQDDAAAPLIILYLNEARIKGDVAEELAKAQVRVRPYESVRTDLRHVLRDKKSFIEFILKSKDLPDEQKGLQESTQPSSAPKGSDTCLDAPGKGAQMLWLDPTVNVSVYATANECDARTTLTVTPAATNKAVKNAAELEGMKEAHFQDGVALAKFFTWLEQYAEQQPREPFTEWEVAQVVDSFRALSPSFRGISFSTIASADANAAIVHYRPSQEHSAPVTSSCLFLLDSGGHYAVGGTTDVTRTVHTGTPSEEQRRYFTLVLKGLIGVSRQAFPQGTRGPQLDILARQHLWASGLDYRHGTGHGVGSYLNVHEGPIGISPRLICQAGETELAEGNVLSVEPGFYEKDNLGIRIENLVYIEKATLAGNFEGMKFLRFQQLTAVPIQKKLILPSLLTNEEIQWLNDYHRWVWTQVAPRLEMEAAQSEVVSSVRLDGTRTVSVPAPEETLRWLESATAAMPLHATRF
ncbi:creatinase domain-containing protein [Besnoitia besnoiti]|uniref:Creatinase domain-containing protein n=1 Tax=Besnoitia besnoiti TaxID=94643 RepID=A0A2A9MIZ5_BESBE|nr:creatinase domain-containing protein [Besnoitia besnoiti]PFH37889.1 creatinase domain-containing protein [Besnoitia besnoiti]